MDPIRILPDSDGDLPGPVPVVLPRLCESWAARFCAGLVEIAASTSEAVRVSCSETPEFSGEPGLEQHVMLSLGAFCRRARAPLAPADVQLFLTQLRIDERLPSLARLLPSHPPFFDSSSYVSPPVAHLWWSAGATLSAAHQDADDNVLCVISGSKTVALAAPAALLAAAPPLSQGGAHHSACNLFRRARDPRPGSLGEWWLPSYCLPEELSLPGTDDRGSVHGFVDRTLAAWTSAVAPPATYSAIARVYFVTIRAGDALFVPEGWWHSVVSSPGTIAVNYWARRRSVAAVLHPTEALHWARVALLADARSRLETSIAEHYERAKLGLQRMCVDGAMSDRAPGTPASCAIDGAVLAAVDALSRGAGAAASPDPQCVSIVSAVVVCCIATMAADDSRGGASRAAHAVDAIFAVLDAAPATAVMLAVLSAEAATSPPDDARACSSSLTSVAARTHARVLLDSLSQLSVCGLARRWEAVADEGGPIEPIALQHFFAQLWWAAFGDCPSLETSSESDAAKARMVALEKGAAWLRGHEQAAMSGALSMAVQEATGAGL